jgi:hypothetical protein
MNKKDENRVKLPKWINYLAVLSLAIYPIVKLINYIAESKDSKGKPANSIQNTNEKESGTKKINSNNNSGNNFIVGDSAKSNILIIDSISGNNDIKIEQKIESK